MKTIDEKLLRVFIENTNQHISGEELARELSLSRTAIWNHVDGLRQLGYDIEARPHLGYRLISTPDRLLRDEILARLKTAIMGREIFSFQEVDSTNDLAIRFAEEGAPEGTLVVAEKQRQGRGRMRRQWHSPPYAGIWSSLILRPKLPPFEISLLTLRAALAVVRAIKQVTGLSAKIKWPNDILFSGKKVCGILSEMSSEADQIHFVVVGVGINVNLKQEDFPLKLQPIATSLSAQKGELVSRVQFICRYLEEFENLCALPSADILNEIKNECDSLGKQVQIKKGDQTISGMALDIESTGALILRLPNGTLEKVYSGDLEVY